MGTMKGNNVVRPRSLLSISKALVNNFSLGGTRVVIRFYGVISILTKSP